MKRIICLIAVIYSMLPSSSQGLNSNAIDVVTVENVRYEIHKSYFDGETGLYAIVLPLEDFDNPQKKMYEGTVEIKESIKYGESDCEVLYIGPNAFRSCTELNEVILPENIYGLMSHAFAECGELRLNQISSIRFIESYAFNKTNAIVNVDLRKIARLGGYAFAGWDISDITLGTGLSMLQTYAFKDSNVKNIVFENSDDFTDSELLIAAHAFTQFNVTELKIPNRELLTLSSEFCYDCPTLERIILPDKGLINFSGDFQTWDNRDGRFTQSDNLIAKCPNLKELVVMSVAPPKFYQWTEENIQTPPITDDYSLCVLKVPQGSENLYRADPVWGRFEHIEGFAPGEYSGSGEATIVDVIPESAPIYYNLQGFRVADPVKGRLYIRVTDTKSAKVIY